MKKNSNKATKNQINKSEAKPTRCSECRYLKEGCYKRSHLLSEQEYIDCVPAMIHASEKKLASMGLI